MNGDLSEFLNEWKYHSKFLGTFEFINFYGLTQNPDTLNYMVVMNYANQDLMKKCWNEDPFKRPSTKEVLVIIEKWIMFPKNMAIEDIDKELKHNVMEFINAPIVNNNPVTKPHSQAFYTSRLLDFSSKKLNEILDSQANVKVDEILVSEDLNDCIIKD
ncbi:unnamed protein product [Rhizophagus irregularis]|nr:unnamed protein product [Rhizophagus irregularis]